MQRRTTRKKLMSVLLVSAVVLATGILIAQPIRSMPSTLTQQILPTDCVITVIVGEDGQQLVGMCDAEAPVIISVETTSSGARIIRGFYDADKTAVLRLFFQGVMYVAGTNGSPLEVHGDAWVFHIDQVPQLVAGGAVMVLVESILIDGRTLSTTATITIASSGESIPDGGFGPGVARGDRNASDAPYLSHRPFTRATDNNLTEYDGVESRQGTRLGWHIYQIDKRLVGTVFNASLIVVSWLVVGMVIAALMLLIRLLLFWRARRTNRTIEE